MTLDRLLLLPLAAGLTATFVVTFNVVHALGHRERLMDRAKLGLLGLFGAAGLAFAWEAYRGPFRSWPWPSLAVGSACLAVGLVALPLSTAYLHLRRRPAGIGERLSEVDLSARGTPAEFTGTGKYAWLLRLPGNESLRLCKAEWEVPLPGLPPALDGLSLVHLSDLHFAPCFDRRYFEAVIDEAAAWPADLVLFTGDLVDHDDAAEWVVPLLSRLRGRLGAFSILGNHDVEHHPDRLRRALELAGFTDLEGRWGVVESEGTTLALGGTSYPWGPPLPLADRPRADFLVLLSHTPDLFYWAGRAGFDLMLSGHNHGGQVRLPMVGPVFMPSRYSRRFDRGFFRKGGLTLHVSQGVAGKHPVRYGCVPQVGRLVLRSTAENPRHAAHARRDAQDQYRSEEALR